MLNNICNQWYSLGECGGTPFPQIFFSGNPVPPNDIRTRGTVIQQRSPKWVYKECKVMLILGKIIEIIEIVANRDFGWGSAPDSARELSAPPIS